jgi:hypothetical protein
MGEGNEIKSMHPRGTSRVLLHAVKSYDMGPFGFTSHPRGRCAANFYRPYKSIALAGFEPATFWPSTPYLGDMVHTVPHV